MYYSIRQQGIGIHEFDAQTDAEAIQIATSTFTHYDDLICYDVSGGRSLGGKELCNV